MRPGILRQLREEAPSSPSSSSPALRREGRTQFLLDIRAQQAERAEDAGSARD